MISLINTKLKDMKYIHITLLCLLKKGQKFRLAFYCIFWLLVLSSAKTTFANVIDTPTIVFGKAKLTGRVTLPTGVNKESIFVKIAVAHQISGDYVKYSTPLDQSGNFSIDADVEASVSFIHFSTTFNPDKSLLVKLKSGEVTNLNITYDSNFDIGNIDIKPAMNKDDMRRSFALVGEMVEYRPNRPPKALYDKSTDEFLLHAKNVVAERLTIVNNEPSVSNELKAMLTIEFPLFMYNGHVFNYEQEMKSNYRNITGDTSKQFKAAKIDRSYFHFLKDFKLNDPQYLQTLTFLEFQKSILQNEILAIHQIEETDIATWLKNVKGILKDLVGFNDGQYYDILAANAYGRQLTEEVKPLSKKQKENIQKYWGNGAIAKILFRKNEQVDKLNKFKSPLVINNASMIAADKLIETIISKHKDKVILIDLWATWCGPCLEAMQRFRSTKAEFHDKDVVFVYLTNGSSPLKLWEEKIKGIGSEHYYLDDKQWEHVMNEFGFEAIPSYLLYNKKGTLNNKFTGFPENEEVKAMINGLL